MASISVSNDGPPYAMTTSMRKFAPNALRLLLAVILAMAAFACTSPPAPEPTATPDIEATITADVTAALPTSTPRLLQSQLPRVILPPRLPPQYRPPSPPCAHFDTFHYRPYSYPANRLAATRFRWSHRPRLHLANRRRQTHLPAASGRIRPLLGC